MSLLARLDKSKNTIPGLRLVEYHRLVRKSLYALISPAEILMSLEVNPGQVRKELRGRILEIIDKENLVLPQVEKEELITYILNDILGFGPIEPLLGDTDISEIMVNGPYRVFIEKNGKIEETDIVFEDADHVMNLIDKIVAPVGRRIDESSPMVDARLPDGSRVNVIIPPLSISGPTITIRKFRRQVFTMDELVELGTITAPMKQFFDNCIRARLNIIVTGGTGSGKTTFLNALSSLIPLSERIITIEDSAELRFNQPHVISLESRPPNIEGKGKVSIRDLVINALRMRPERLVVGEVRGGEALDMLQAMNTGHDGSLTTAHANSPKEAISRIETMAMMAGMELPIEAIREQIAGGISLIIHLGRFPGGSRKVSEISEVANVIAGHVELRNIIFFKQSGVDETGAVKGDFYYSGTPPKFIDNFDTLSLPKIDYFSLKKRIKL